MERYFEHLFTPMTIRGTRFRNRIFAGPNSARLRTSAGGTTAEEIAYYEERARGGAAVVTVGETMVNYHYLREARSFHLNVRDVNNHPMLNELSRAIAVYGAVPSIQLNHPGVGSTVELLDGAQPVSVSDTVLENGLFVPAMTEDMIEQAIEDFAEAAKAVKDCGFAMLQIHGGHGWLINQFLSPLYNHRTDRWGGTLENRARFAIKVLDRVREAVGPRFIIDYRISGDEMLPEGMHIGEMVEFVRMIEDKIDLLHVSAAIHDCPEVNYLMFPHTEFTEPGCNVYLAETIKKAGIKVPVATIGGIGSPDLAEQILAEGKADIVCMSRAMIADPEWVNKARNGKKDEIRPCLRCSECLIGLQYNRFGCQVNPQIGHSQIQCRISNAVLPKKIVVVGGGPAGMESAITAAEHGHEVILFEKSGRLGGQLNHADFDPHKTELRNYRNYLEKKTRKLVKDIRLNTLAGAEEIRMLAPDAVIVAAGAEPVVPKVPGINRENVIGALEAYKKSETLGQRVTVIGGGLVGCEFSIMLAETGRDVTIVEMTKHIGDPVNWRHTLPMTEKMKTLEHLTVRRETTVVEVNEKGVLLKDMVQGKTFQHDCDTVVYSIGLRPRWNLVDELQEVSREVYPVGDCLKTGKIMGAVHGAYYTVMNLS